MIRTILRVVATPAALLWIAIASSGCAQLAGIEETSLGPKHAYACKCACSAGGESFSLNSNVCVPDALNPALNPDLPADFEPSSEALRQDCSTRVERNLESMSRQCIAQGIQCTCAGIAELTSSFDVCDAPCAGEDLAADCSNFDPANRDVTATNVPGEAPVCVVNHPDGSGRAALAAAIFGRTTQCEVTGDVTVTRDDESQTHDATGVASFEGKPCPGGACAVGVSYLLDHVDSFSFDGFAGFASVEFEDIGASGVSVPEAALVGADGLAVLPPATMRNTGKGRRSNQVLGGEISSDSAAYTGANDAPLDVLVGWSDHACALRGGVLGTIEDADTAVDVDLGGTIVNQPPSASAAATPREVECTSPAGATVTLDGGASSDPESNLALFAWRRGTRAGADLGTDRVVQLAQPLGTRERYVLQVVDAFGQAAQDAAAVAVVDTTPPTIAQVSASPARLWPPNHRMVPVTVTAAASDVCGAASCVIASVASNEPPNGKGDGNTASDWRITGPGTVELRAERAGGGSGRVYTIAVRCTDPGGNAATGTTTVTVAH